MEFTHTVNSEKQHTELGISRRHTDFSNCMKFYEWFKIKNHFKVRNDNLFSSLSGIALIRGRDAEDVGTAIYAAFDNMEYHKCCSKRKNVITPLACLHSVKNIKVVSDQVNH